MNRQGAYIAAIGGHLVDLYRLLTFQVQNPHSISKLRNINAVRKACKARSFIETGTYRGVTAARASRMFERVFTIELDPVLAAEARDYLRQFPNVEAITGDALAVLSELLVRDDVQDVVVFLDGHFSGGGTAHGDLAEPAVLEIDVLARHRNKLCGIVIDDFRCFGKEPGFPTKAEILHAVERHFNDEFEVMIHLDQILVTRTTRIHPE